METNTNNVPSQTKRKYAKKTTTTEGNIIDKVQKTLMPVQLKFAPEILSTEETASEPKSIKTNNEKEQKIILEMQSKLAEDDVDVVKNTKKSKSSNSSTTSNTTVSSTKKNGLLNIKDVVRPQHSSAKKDNTLMNSHTSNTDYNTLFAFGLSPDTSPAAKGNINFGRISSITTRLRAAKVETETGTCIVFRVEAINPTSSTWMGKIFRDEVEKEAKWTQSLNFSTQIYYWYHNNVVQYNEKNYKINLVHMRVKGKLLNDTVIKIGQHICTQLNKIEGNKNKITVVENVYFWLPKGAVWSDVIGHDQSYNTIVNDRGIPNEGEKYYEIHKKLIDTHYHVGTLPPTIANRFGIYSQVPERVDGLSDLEE